LRDSDRYFTGVVRPTRWDGKASGTCQRTFSWAMAVLLKAVPVISVAAARPWVKLEIRFFKCMNHFLLVFVPWQWIAAMDMLAVAVPSQQPAWRRCRNDAMNVVPTLAASLAGVIAGAVPSALNL
jgi:hypothetical protein